MMKVGEALTLRADLYRRISEVRARLAANVVVQEGEVPTANPNDLLVEAHSLCDQLEKLLANINLTNSQTKMDDGRTVTEAIAERDILNTRIKVLDEALDLTHDHRGFFRHLRSEIKQVRTIDVAAYQRERDKLAKRRRELDVVLQAHNWTTNLIEF